MGSGKSKLTDRQRRFCKEYPIDLNATQAAIRAGYAKGTANREGTRLLSNAVIQEQIKNSISRTEEKLEITTERIMAEYAKLGFSNIADYGEWDDHGNVTMKPASELGDKTAAIQEISIQQSEGDGETRQRVIKFKLHPKIAALDSLCKMKGLFVERRELSGPDGGPIAVRNASELTDDQLAAIAAGK